MESQTCSQKTIRVARDGDGKPDVSSSRPLDSFFVRRIDQALAVAAESVGEALDAFRQLAGSSIPLSPTHELAPVLLSIPEVCKLLGYHKTKVYDLMQRGLLPFVVHTENGHRRVEYAALQAFVKRPRSGRPERITS